jgi:hypothetical protein
MFKLKFYFKHIGDQICTTALPENIFHATGEKCVITDPAIWAFKHNPYVIHLEETQCPTNLPEIHVVPDNRIAEHREHYSKTTGFATSAGQTEFMCINLNILDPVLRHPRLYFCEDSRTEPDKIVVSTSGSDRTRDNEPAIRFNFGEDSVRVMSDDIIDAIEHNYRDYRIFQVGSLADKPLKGKFTDLRGIDYWDAIKEISTASRFIGVDSGPRHMANCFPRIDKRIVLVQFPKETLLKSRPGDVNHWLFSWLDMTNTFFNRYEQDIAYTYSYKKI